MRTLLLLAIAVALPGCRSDPAASSTTAAVDALWALAPAGVRGAIVLSPRSLTMAEHAFADVRATFDREPEFAPAKTQLEAMFAPVGGPSITLADLGFTPTKGAALFLVKDGMIAILPVADRDKFLARVKGTKGATAADVDRIDTATCKLVREFYACATAEPLLASIGGGQLKQELAAAGARGDIEIVGTELPFGGTQPGVAALVLQLSRGAAVVRGTVTRAPHELTARFTRTGTSRADAGHSAGFALIDLTSVARPSPEVVLGDVTIERVLSSLDGMLSIVIPAGPLAFDIELPLKDPAPFTTIIERCGELPGAEMLAAKFADGACHVSVPQLGLALDAWVDQKRLRVGNKAKPVTGAAIAMTPVGRELARGTWSFAVWGRGTMMAEGAMSPIAAPAALDPDAAVMIRLMALVNELGLGVRLDGEQLRILGVVRTAFANPDDVVAKLTKITAAEIATSRAAAPAKPIADAAPGSPFAADFKAGQGGLMIPTALVGMGAAIAIPAMLQYREGADDEDAPDPGVPAPITP